MTQIQIKPEYEKLLPVLTDAEFSELEKSIKEHGQWVPIIVNSENVLLDGHHRYKACVNLGIEPKFETRTFDNPLLEKEFVIECNLNRRQLTKFQIAELLVPLIDIKKELARQNMSKAGKGETIDAPLGRVTDNIAKDYNISGKTLERVKKILEDAPEELKESARTGQISINSAYDKITKQERTPTPIPEEEFSVIMVSPQWQRKINAKITSNDPHTMTLDRICSLKIPSAKDSVVFLWVSPSNLKQGLLVLESWGFEYKTCLVWVKQKAGSGQYFQNQHELLLVGKKGDFPTPEENNRVSSVLQNSAACNSKPVWIYRTLEEMYPNQKYLEIFSIPINRTQYPDLAQNWTCLEHHIENVKSDEFSSSMNEVTKFD